MRDSIARRLDNLRDLLAKPHLQVLVKLHLANNVVDFFNDWVWTYDPRRVPADLPFDLFPMQAEYLLWRNERLATKTNGLVEKSRDMGVTWMNAGWHVWRWRFHQGHKGTFGSRKQDLVDKSDDPDSIFEKMRYIIERLPAFLRPAGWDKRKHSKLLLLFNPENGNALTGEGGENMGRGGRSTVYDADEFAFVERAEITDRALLANSDVIIYTSTPNGPANLFAKKRMGGNIVVFTLHWTDHPDKTEEWYLKMVESYDGDEVAIAQELDIDYYASVEGVLIKKLHVDRAMLRELYDETEAAVTIGGDIATYGSDKSAAVVREGRNLLWAEEWHGHDPIESAQRIISIGLDAEQLLKAHHKLYLFVDAIGVGAGTVAELERWVKANRKGRWIVIGVVAGEKSPEEKCYRLRDALWWRMRKWFMEEQPAISADIDGQVKQKLANDVAKVTYDVKDNGIVHIVSKRELKKKGIASPDIADALIHTFFWEAQNPAEDNEPGWLKRRRGKHQGGAVKKRGRAA